MSASQRPSGRVSFGEAIVPVSCLVEQVDGASVDNRKKVGQDEPRSGVSSTLGHTRSKASKHLDQFLKMNRTRFTTLFTIVSLCLFFKCCSHRPNHFDSTCSKKGCWKHCLVVRRVHVCKWKPSVEVQRTPNTQNISALPSCWCRMIYSNVHEHSEKDFYFYPCVA